MSDFRFGGSTQVDGNFSVWTSATITSAGVVSAADFRDYSFSGSKALISDSNKSIVESNVTSAQIGYLSTTSADIQSQLTTLSGSRLFATNGADNRVATFSNSNTLNGESQLTFDGNDLTIRGIANGRLNVDTVSASDSGIRFQLSGTNTWFVGIQNKNYTVLDYSTGNEDIQITSGASGTIRLGSNSTKKVNLPSLSTSAVVVTDGSKNLVSSNITTTKLNYLNGVTSDIQTQLDSKQNLNSHNIANGNLGSGYIKFASFTLTSSAACYDTIFRWVFEGRTIVSESIFKKATVQFAVRRETNNTINGYTFFVNDTGTLLLDEVSIRTNNNVNFDCYLKSDYIGYNSYYVVTTELSACNGSYGTASSFVATSAMSAYSTVLLPTQTGLFTTTSADFALNTPRPIFYKSGNDSYLKINGSGGNQDFIKFQDTDNSYRFFGDATEASSTANALIYAGGFYDTSFTNGKVLVSNTNEVTESSITSTELGYLSSTSANIQTQINSKQNSFTIAQNQVAVGGTNTVSGSNYLTFNGTELGVGLSANINNPTLILRQNPGTPGGGAISLGAAGTLNDENSGKLYLPGQRIIGLTNSAFKHQRYNSTTSAYETTFGIESGNNAIKDINFYGDLLTVSATNPRLVIDGPAGNSKGIRFNDAGTIRWYAGTLQNNSFVVQDVIANDFPISAVSGSSGAIVLGGTNNRKVNITSLNTSAVVVTDGSKNLVSSPVTTTELSYLTGTSANIQTQLNSKQPNLTIAQNQVAVGGTNVVSGSDLLTFNGTEFGVGVSAIINGPIIKMLHNPGKPGGPEIRLGAGAGGVGDENSAKLYLGGSRIINTTEPHIKFQRYNSTTSAYETYMQTDFTNNASKDIRFHGNVIVSAYSGNKALVSNGSKVITESSVTTTELSYLAGTSANIQTQINSISAVAFHTNRSNLDSINQNLNTSSSVEFGTLKLGEKVAVATLGNTPWIYLGPFPKTAAGESNKYHVSFIGGDYADAGKMEFVYDSFNITSAVSFLPRRTISSWRHASNELYSKIQFKCFYSSATNNFHPYVALSGVDYSTLAAEVTVTNSSGILKYKTSATSTLPSTGYVEMNTRIVEQPVRMIGDSAFLRNTSVARTTEFVYGDGNTTSQISFDGTSVSVQNRLKVPASVTSASSLNIAQGVAPTSPVAGDVWFDGNYQMMQNNSGTRYKVITPGLSANYIPRAINDGGRIDNSSIMDDGNTVSTPNLSATTLIVGNVTNTQIQYLSNTSADIQNQINSVSALKANFSIVISGTSGLVGGGDLTQNRTLGLELTGTSGTYTKVSTDKYGRVIGSSTLTSGDIPTLPASKIGTGIIDDTEFNYLDGVSANIQSQLTSLSGSKVDKTIQVIAGTGLTGGGTLSANVTVTLPNIGTVGTYTKVSTDAQGRVSAATNITSADVPILPATKIGTGIIDDTEFNRLDGVSANIQTQLTNLSASKQNLLTNPVTGTGTSNYIPKFTAASTIGNSIIQDSGTVVTIGGHLTATNISGATLTIGNISNTEFSYLDNVSANIQTQLNQLAVAAVSGSGAGTPNKLTKFVTSSSMGDSTITDTGSLVTFSTQITVPRINLPNNTQSLYVGDDASIGDVNYAHTIGVVSQSNASLGYVKFGSDTNTLGYDGTTLSYGGTAKIGNVSATNISGTTINIGNVSNTEFGYLDTVSANIQTQLTNLSAVKVDKTIQVIAGTGLTGGGTLSANVTISMPSVGTAGTFTKVSTDAQGRVSAATNITSADVPTLPATKIGTGIVDDTEFNRLDGVSANIQTQLGNLSAVKANSSQLTAYLPLVGGSMTGDITFQDDGEGITTFGGGRFYKKVGTGLVTRLHAGNIRMQVEDNAGTILGTYWDSGNLPQTSINNWNSVYTSVNSTSANWNSVYTTVNTTSANWNSVYTTVNTTSANWNTAYTNNHTHSNKTNLDLINQNLNTSATISASIFVSTKNGIGTNFKVGDDAWIGDIDQEHTLSIRSQTDSTRGFVRFGNDAYSFGYDGTTLLYPSAFALGVLNMTKQPVGTYDNGTIPTYYIGQEMANTDFWRIYGEGTDNNGRLVLEVGDDATEGVVIKKRNSGAGTSTVYSIWSTENFDPSTKITKSGDSGIGNLTMADNSQIIWNYDVTPTTAANTNYISAPVRIQRLATAGTAQAAGIGFHNLNVNAAFLYYDPATSHFMFNRNTSGPLVTVWDSSNLTPSDYLPISAPLGNSSDWYTFSTTGTGDSGSLILTLSDNNDGTESFLINNAAGTWMANFLSNGTVILADDRLRLAKSSTNIDLWNPQNGNYSVHLATTATKFDFYRGTPGTGTSIGSVDGAGLATFNGETLNGDLIFSNITGGGRGIYGQVGNNDGWRIIGGAPSDNNGYLEIATTDDGQEPIYVRQYSNGGGWNNYTGTPRTLTLLDASGDTSIPGSLTIGGGANKIITTVCNWEKYTSGPTNAAERIDIVNPNAGSYSNAFGLDFYYSGTQTSIAVGDPTGCSYKVSTVGSNISSTLTGPVTITGNITLNALTGILRADSGLVSVDSRSFVQGTGSAERIPRWVSSIEIGDSSINETTTKFQFLNSKIMDLRTGRTNLTQNLPYTLVELPIGTIRYSLNQNGSIVSTFWSGADSGNAPTILQQYAYGQIGYGVPGSNNGDFSTAYVKWDSTRITLDSSVVINNVEWLSYKQTPLLTANTTLSADITYYTISATANRTITLPASPKIGTIYYLNVIDELYTYKLNPNSGNFILFRDMSDVSWRRGSASQIPILRSGMHLVSCYYDGSSYIWSLDGNHSQA